MKTRFTLMSKNTQEAACGLQGTHKTISLLFMPTYGQNENSEVWAQHPVGRMEISRLSEEAAMQFVPGEDYHIDINHVNKA